MQAHTHIAISMLLLVVASQVAQFQLSPLLVTLFLVSSIFPDIDIIAGMKYHRKGTHTFLFCIIYGLIFTVLAREASQIFGGFISVALVAIMLGILWAYYKGKLSIAARRLAALLAASFILCVEMAWWGNDVTTKAIFLACAGGAAAHIFGDLISASDGSRLQIFWPLKKKYGRRLVKTGGLSEDILYAIALALLVVALYYRGGNIRKILDSIVRRI